MQTTIIKINPKTPESEKIKLIAKAIRNGKLVSFPTETVYGLGANAFNPLAVSEIFKVKGRPQDNPLIAHISDSLQVKKLAKDFPESAKKLTKKFWPGPLTIVLKKKKIVPDVVTAGLDSIAIRMPNNKIALELIKQSKVPIVAPSANLSGKPSPTKAKHVVDDLSGKIEYIIDGGNCKIGIESTVIDFTSIVPTILRPGYITKEDIEEVIGEVEFSNLNSKNKDKPKSPGMKYTHYSPKAKVILIDYNRNFLREIELIKQKNPKKKIGILSYSFDLKEKNVKYLNSDYKIYAQKLFSYFRDFDKNKIDIIIAQGIEEDQLGKAIMNRLKKASTIYIK
jgi:L-threonylcarbamoyladenylate synthase